jgi:hypothetical protein
MSLLLKHQTASQFVTRFREAYRNAERERLVQMAKWILSALSRSDITDAQCRNAFGLNTNQWNTLKTKMQNFVDASNAVQSAVGE